MRFLDLRRNGTIWVLAGGLLFCLAASLPGHLSYDSIMQLNEGRRGFYANWHPPMMSWLLGVFDSILPGTALFTSFDIALFFASLAALYHLARNPSPAAAITLAGVVLTPQVVLYQGIVWKDVLFADLAIAGFAALAVAGECWERKWLRYEFAALAFVLLSVATLVRQNGGVVLPAGIACLAWFAASKSNMKRRWRAAFLYGASAVAGCFIAVAGMHAALATRIPGDPSPAVAFRLLEFYDLIGAVKNDASLSLPYLDDDDVDLERLMRTDGTRLYSPQRNDTLADSGRLQRAYFDSPDETIPEEWHHLVAAHPWLYLSVRWSVFREVFLTPDLPGCRPVFAGISGPLLQMAKLGIKARFDSRDAILDYYARRFMGTPIFSHLFFALVALLGSIVLFLRRRPADVAMALMLVSALAFVASFFVISIACDYRYLYFLDLAALTALFHLSLDWQSAWRQVRSLVSQISNRPRTG
ncbi:MAG TPA: hypothetical protein VN154_13060 [Rhizomicrobium sp.]|nr:hypothetical protein [Rhizomicrobium sp.]